MTWLLMALFKARSLAGKAFAWLTASAVHMLIAGCIVLALWGVYQRGQAHKWHNIAGERLASLERLPPLTKPRPPASQRTTPMNTKPAFLAILLLVVAILPLTGCKSVPNPPPVVKVQIPAYLLQRPPCLSWLACPSRILTPAPGTTIKP